MPSAGWGNDSKKGSWGTNFYSSGQSTASNRLNSVSNISPGNEHDDFQKQSSLPGFLFWDSIGLGGDVYCISISNVHIDVNKKMYIYICNLILMYLGVMLVFPKRHWHERWTFALSTWRWSFPRDFSSGRTSTFCSPAFFDRQSWAFPIFKHLRTSINFQQNPIMDLMMMMMMMMMMDDWLIHWLIDWLSEWVSDWMIGWLVDWLVALLIDW